jgi:hypothetical protein
MRTASLTLAACLAAPAAAPAADPPIVFQTQPTGRILDDFRAVTKMIGGDKAVKTFNDGIKQALGEKGYEGLDLVRPLLGYVVLAANLDDVVAVVAVPVTGEKEFLDLVERMAGAKPKLGKDGLYELPFDAEGAKALMRFDARHAYIAVGKNPATALDPKALVAPAKLYDPADKALVSVRVYFDRMPKELRDQIATGIKELKTLLDSLRLPEEASEPARKAVDELVNLGTRYADLLKDAETAGARVILDVNSGEAALEIGLTGKPDSPLAKVIAARRPSTNKFAGLITPDTVAGLKLQLPFFAPELQKAAVIGLEAGQKHLAGSAPPQFKAAIDETFKGLIRTVNDGEFDLAASLRGPDKEGLYTVVGAVAFEDPSALEKELRALIKKELPPDARGLINMDVARVGKTNIHQAKIGGLLPAGVQKVFGEDASLAFAFAPNGVFLAFGPDAVGALKTALEVKKAPSPALEVVVNPQRLGKFVTTLGAELPPGVAKLDKLIPALSLTVEGGKELRLRLGTNLKWMEGIGGVLSGGADRPPPGKER